jgi:hypothetical protein
LFPHAIRDRRIDEANVPQRDAKLVELSQLAQAPLDFLGRYVRGRGLSHDDPPGSVR